MQQTILREIPGHNPIFVGRALWRLLGKSIVCCDAWSGIETRRIEIDITPVNMIKSDDGKILVVWDPVTVCVVDACTGEKNKVITANASRLHVIEVAFCSDTDIIVLTWNDLLVRINTLSGKTVDMYQYKTEDSYGIICCKKRRRAYIKMNDDIEMFDFAQRRSAVFVTGFEFGFSCMKWYDEDTIITVADEFVYFWDAEDGSELKNKRTKILYYPYTVTPSSSGHFVVNCKRKSTAVHRMSDLAVVCCFDFSLPCWELFVSPCGNLFVYVKSSSLVIARIEPGIPFEVAKSREWCLMSNGNIVSCDSPAPEMSLADWIEACDALKREAALLPEMRSTSKKEMFRKLRMDVVQMIFIKRRFPRVPKDVIECVYYFVHN